MTLYDFSDSCTAILWFQPLPIYGLSHMRQGNIFPEVHICAYVTENSFDSFMWGLVESKARFIS